ncbi:MAG TPA: radical SAM family heme chaperone HemW [Anaerolineales bacterium]|jgi:oxygen-independent coproporphyrinogen-3 oxidase|nr:radical SAM family heme chaperone HemW [Anaerolineales bacterium]
MIPVYSIYIHIPFCTHRCAYCDFNTYAGQESSIPAYVDALCREIEFVGTSSRREDPTRSVHTIFFGGGTPSLLTPDQFDVIFQALRDYFTFTDDVEITTEANPGTVSYADLMEWRRIGINRISYGVQSANTEELRMLERIHNFLDVIEAVKFARKAGFENLNLDLIYGLPEQNLVTWQTTVKRILDLHPEHLSAYALTLEHGTPFGNWASKGLLPLPDPDLAAEMYEWLSETLEANGYVQYEISNWAKPGYECRHNLQYWRGLPYLAFGAGAHGYANGYRYSNVLRIKTYIDRIINYPMTNYEFPLSPTTVNQHKQTLADDMSEFMMTGLRLTQEGVSEGEFYRRFGQPMRTIYGKEIDGLLRLGLIENDSGSKIKISQRGRLLGNQVFMRFV